MKKIIIGQVMLWTNMVATVCGYLLFEQLAEQRLRTELGLFAPM